MKKLIILAMIGMITLSCSNDSMETPKADTVQKKEVNKPAAREGEEITKEEQEAIDLIKSDVAGRYVGTTSAYIDCHTSYLSPDGHACVWSNGYLFNVSWNTIYSPGYFGGPKIESVHYTATPTSFCHCR